ncbi:IclR family transcriptional regulator [Novosphingobium pentaromativorans]|uniref:IclR family transcriptional regulator n=1 Tax=Novosphingobium pentaromativorans US6-1 TaxID=1088721 RepID=G6EGD1_9SPHN|nr:helix-turn-helix domain-containing protein [Novosphingobium pentaromativorans]AIT82189.1 hypothetical protein JI59_21970 [Novosphingobium pentaromativorans US6-1]EHJ59820.1 hypothetical protein NSU_3402 [Novosphingobium pentaromativorans US6-1]
MAGSNSAARAIRLLEFMAARPAQTFTLTELARSLGLNKSSVHGIVHTLHDAGWLFRSSQTSRYGLGPAAAHVGAAATEALPELALALPTMDALAAQCQCECIFSELVDDEIVLLGSTGPALINSPIRRPGNRIRFAPPIGTVFVAWQTKMQRMEWIARAGPSDEASIMKFDADMESIRSRGYVVMLQSQPGAWTHTFAADENSPSNDDDAPRKMAARRLTEIQTVEYLNSNDDLLDDDPRLVQSIQAPVFAGGVVRFAITLSQIERRMNVKMLAKLGDMVRHAADRISAEIDEMGKPRFAPSVSSPGQPAASKP